MSVNLENMILDQARALCEEEQRKVLTFIGELKRHQPARQTIWERLDERLSKLPPETFEDIPSDASENLDQYLYGATKSVTYRSDTKC